MPPTSDQQLLGTVSADDLLAQARRREARVAKACVYVPATNTICLTVTHTVEVPLDRIRTPLDLLVWVTHLGQKEWMDTHLLVHFARMAAGVKQWKLNF